MATTSAAQDLNLAPVARDGESAFGWHPATQVAFRFCFVYFGLYVVMTPTLQAFLDPHRPRRHV
jgi:hypothetical protein